MYLLLVFHANEINEHNISKAQIVTSNEVLFKNFLNENKTQKCWGLLFIRLLWTYLKRTYGWQHIQLKILKKQCLLLLPLTHSLTDRLMFRYFPKSDSHKSYLNEISWSQIFTIIVKTELLPIFLQVYLVSIKPLVSMEPLNGSYHFPDVFSILKASEIVN